MRVDAWVCGGQRSGWEAARARAFWPAFRLRDVRRRPPSPSTARPPILRRRSRRRATPAPSRRCARGSTTSTPATPPLASTRSPTPPTAASRSPAGNSARCTPTASASTRDDVKAYHYFNQLVEDYDEDALDPRNRGAVSSAFVAVGVYSLTGIPNSDVRPDPERARELFQYAAATFGDPDAQYNLAHMYIVGAGGLAQDKLVAVRWLMLASHKGHRPSEALLGHHSVRRRRRGAAAGQGADVADHRQHRGGKPQGRLGPRPLPARFRRGERRRTGRWRRPCSMSAPRVRRCSPCSPARSCGRCSSCGRSGYR